MKIKMKNVKMMQFIARNFKFLAKFVLNNLKL